MKTPNGILSQNQCQSFLTLEGEKLIVATREHWVILVAPIVLTVILGSLLTILSFVLFINTLFIPTVFLSSSLLFLIVTSCTVVKIVADWYYHIYYVTTRKIVEVNHDPLFSHSVNDVLLDQVRITEVDTKIRSVLHELLNLGDVIIVFDRPSHQERFIMSHIHGPSEIGRIVSGALEMVMHDSPVWFYPRRLTDVYKFTDEVYEDDRRLNS